MNAGGGSYTLVAATIPTGGRATGGALGNRDGAGQVLPPGPACACGEPPARRGLCGAPLGAPQARQVGPLSAAPPRSEPLRSRARERLERAAEPEGHTPRLLRPDPTPPDARWR